MNVLILGGTGAMGNYLVDELSKDNNKVFVTSRKYKPDTQFVKYIQGDAKDYKFLCELLNQHWDVIVDFMVYSTTEFEFRINKLLGSTCQYVYLSSARVYADSEKPITENSIRLLDTDIDIDYLVTDEYALAKARQENILFNSKNKNWTIVRPYITFGRNRLQLGVLEKERWLYQAMKGRKVVFSKDINEKYTTITSGSDVSMGIMSLIGRREALGEAYHITNNRKILWKDILKTYENILNKYNYSPVSIVLQDISDFYSWYPGQNQVKYDRLYDREFDNSKISKFLSVDDFKNPIDELSHCLESFILSPSFDSIDWKSEANKDRLVGEHASLQEMNNIKQKLIYTFFRYFNFLKI